MPVDWIVGIATIYLLWQQNQIFKQQNIIFAKQGGVAMPPETDRTRWLKRYWPMFAMMILAAVNLGGIGYREYQKHRSFPPEFDDPNNLPLMTGYGLDTPSSCFANLQSKILLAHRSDYKVAIGCFLWDGTVDRLDAPNVQVSNLYDIVDGETALRVTWGEVFNKYRQEQHAVGIIVAVFIVPNGVSITQFTTLRQARALGVRIPSAGIAKSFQPVPAPAIK